MTAKLTEYGMTATMSRKGNCWDNAPTENLFNSLKNERVHGTTYATRADAQADLFENMVVFSTTGVAATPRWATARRLGSSRTGSASMPLSNPWRHTRGRLEGEIRQAPQKCKVQV